MKFEFLKLGNPFYAKWTNSLRSFHLQCTMVGTQNVQDLDWSVEHRDLATLCIENVEHALYHSPAI